MATHTERYIDPELLTLNGGLFPEIHLRAPIDWVLMPGQPVAEDAPAKAAPVEAPAEAAPVEAPAGAAPAEIADRPPPAKIADRSAPDIADRVTPVVLDRPTPVVPVVFPDLPEQEVEESPSALRGRNRLVQALAFVATASASAIVAAFALAALTQSSSPQRTPQAVAAPPGQYRAAAAAGIQPLALAVPPDPVSPPLEAAPPAPVSQALEAPSASPLPAAPAASASAAAAVSRLAAPTTKQPATADGSMLPASQRVSSTVPNVFATPRQFRSSAAAVAIAAAARGARGCVGPDAASAVMTARVLYSPSGRVTKVSLQGPPMGTGAASCIARSLHGASIEPFDGEPTAVTTTIRMR